MKRITAASLAAFSLGLAVGYVGGRRLTPDAAAALFDGPVLIDDGQGPDVPPARLTPFIVKIGDERVMDRPRPPGFGRIVKITLPDRNTLIFTVRD